MEHSFMKRTLLSKKYIALLVLLFIAAVGGVYFWHGSNEQTTSVKQKTRTEAPTEVPPAEDTFDKTQYSLDDPSSIWVVVNKQRPLEPKTYRPSDLTVPNVPLRVPGHETMNVRTETARALESMFAAAKADGIALKLSSGFRSYNYQVNLYNGYVNSQGQAAADTQSARPGYSEHQTGLAADIRPIDGACDLEQCFGDMPEGKWIAENAHNYGFIIRYTKTNEAKAGYSYEPWHIRYVGIDLAAEMQRTQADSLETFFGLPPAPSY